MGEALFLFVDAHAPQALSGVHAVRWRGGLGPSPAYPVEDARVSGPAHPSPGVPRNALRRARVPGSVRRSSRADICTSSRKRIRSELIRDSSCVGVHILRVAAAS